MFLLLFLLFPALIFALPWVIPRRWLPTFGLTVFYIIIYLVLDANRAQCGGCGGFGASLGWGLLVLASAGFLVSFIARWHVTILSGNEITRSSASSQRTTVALVAIGLACMALWQTVVMARSWFDHGFWIHCVVLLLVLGWVTVGWFYRGKKKRFEWLIFSSAGALTTLCAMAWSLQVSTKAIAAAETAAAGEPYCLLTSGRSGLRSVRDRLDLSGFVMHAGPYSPRHAKLAIGESRDAAWLYWSYRNEAFEPDFLGGVLTCELQQNTAKDLDWFRVSADPLDLSFWLARGQWLIPADYRGGASDYPPVLSFYARGKDFAAMPPLPLDQAIGEIYTQKVSVTLCDLDRLHVWHALNDANHKVEPAGMEAGLEIQTVESRGSPHKKLQYVGRDEVGRISTWLMCDRLGSTCRHAFRRDGVVVELQYAVSRFPQWKETQDAVWKRVKSFSVVWPDAEPERCKP